MNSIRIASESDIKFVKNLNIFRITFHIFSDGFDILVNDCYAHNGANKKIQLIDHHGCPVDEKLISRFQGTWGMTDNMYDTLVYAHMKMW